MPRRWLKRHPERLQGTEERAAGAVLLAAVEGAPEGSCASSIPGLRRPTRSCWRCRRMTPDAQELASMAAQVPFPVVTQGAPRSCEAILCFAGRSRNPICWERARLPRHMEFLVDRFGFLRARWIPDADGHRLGSRRYAAATARPAQPRKGNPPSPRRSCALRGRLDKFQAPGIQGVRLTF